MYNILTLNKISETGLCNFSDEYNCATEIAIPDAILVRSAAMHDMEFADNTLAIARVGAKHIAVITAAKRKEKSFVFKFIPFR